MAAQPARSSRARIRIVPPSSAKPGRSKTIGVDGAIRAGCRSWIVTSRSPEPSGVGPSNGRVSAKTGSLPSGRTSTGVGLVREAAGTPPSAAGHDAVARSLDGLEARVVHMGDEGDGPSARVGSPRVVRDDVAVGVAVNVDRQPLKGGLDVSGRAALVERHSGPGPEAHVVCLRHAHPFEMPAS